ncbi:MAG: Nif11-like leader peptide family natural product precursor [Cyanobium sp.]
MSWSELERLVEVGESDGALRRALRHCRSEAELLLACQRLGFEIEADDLRLARTLHQRDGQEISQTSSRSVMSGAADSIAADNGGISDPEHIAS